MLGELKNQTRPMWLEQSEREGMRVGDEIQEESRDQTR